jgi:hypothetical protein
VVFATQFRDCALLSTVQTDKDKEDVMITRRLFTVGFAATLLAPGTAVGQTKTRKFQLDPIFLPQSVEYETDLPIGSVVVDPKDKISVLYRKSVQRPSLRHWSRPRGSRMVG